MQEREKRCLCSLQGQALARLGIAGHTGQAPDPMQRPHGPGLATHTGPSGGWGALSIPDPCPGAEVEAERHSRALPRRDCGPARDVGAPPSSLPRSPLARLLLGHLHWAEAISDPESHPRADSIGLRSYNSLGWNFGLFYPAG